MSTGVFDVAAKRAGRPAKKGRDKVEPRRIIMLVSPEYDEWLERRAVQLRTTKSGAIDRMLAEERLEADEGAAGLRAGEMFLRILPRLSEPSGHVTQAEGMQPSLAYRCGGSSG